MSEIPDRPSVAKPDWFVTDALDRVEPSGSRKLSGWTPLQPLPAQNENWLLYSISIWLAYLDEFVFTYLGQFFGSMARGYEIINNSFTIDPDQDDGKVFLCTTASGGINCFLPAPEDFEGKKFTIKDNGNRFGDVNRGCTLERDGGSEDIEGLNADYTLESNGGTWTIYCDGTDFWLC